MDHGTPRSVTTASPLPPSAAKDVSRPSVPKQPFRVSMLHYAPTLGIANTLVCVPGNNVKANNTFGSDSQRPGTRGSSPPQAEGSPTHSPMRSHPPACAVLFLNPTQKHTGWTELECQGNAPAGRRNHIAVALDGCRIAVHGGERASGSKFGDMHILQLGNTAPSTQAQQQKEQTLQQNQSSHFLSTSSMSYSQPVTPIVGPANSHPAAAQPSSVTLLSDVAAAPSATPRLRPRSWVEVTRSPAACDKHICDIPALSHHAGVARGEGIFLSGGYNAQGAVNTLFYAVNIKLGAAVVLADLKLPLVDHLMAIDGEAIVVYGGTWGDTGEPNTDVFRFDPYGEAIPANQAHDTAYSESPKVPATPSDKDLPDAPREIPSFVRRITAPVPKPWLRRMSQWSPSYFDPIKRVVVKCHPRVTFAVDLPPLQDARRRSSPSVGRRSDANNDSDYEDDNESARSRVEPVDNDVVCAWRIVAGHAEDCDDPAAGNDDDYDEDDDAASATSHSHHSDNGSVGPHDSDVNVSSSDRTDRTDDESDTYQSSSRRRKASEHEKKAATPEPAPTPEPETETEGLIRGAAPTPWAVISDRLYLVIKDNLLAFDCITAIWVPEPVGRVAKVAHILPRVMIPNGPTQPSSAPAGATSPNNTTAVGRHSKASVRYPATPSTPMAAPYRPFQPPAKPQQPVWDRTASRAGATGGIRLLPALLPKNKNSTSSSADAVAAPRPPHTARPRMADGRFETPRMHRKKEQEAQRQVHHSALTNMQHLSKGASEASTAACLKAINTQINTPGCTAVDMTAMNGGKVDLATVFLVEKALPAAPQVVGLHVAGCNIDSASCEALHSMIVRVKQVQTVTGLDTATLCNGDASKAATAEEKILEACGANRRLAADEEARRRQRKLDRKARRDEKRRRKAEEQELPAARRRVQVAFDSFFNFTVRAERFIRDHWTLMEESRRERVQLLERENMKALLEYLRRIELYNVALGEVARRELVSREAIINEQLKEQVSLGKQERDGRRKAMALIMTRHKKFKAEREAFERSEKAARTDLKTAEDASVKALRDESARLKAWYDRVKAERDAEHEKRESEQRRLDKAAAERQRQREEELRKIREEIEALMRRQGNEEKEINNNEKKAMTLINNEIRDSLKRIEAIEAKRQRFADRATCSAIAPILSVDKWSANVPWCTGSDCPVPVSDPNAVMTCSLVCPDYMNTPMSLTQFMGDSKNSSPLAQSQGSTGDYGSFTSDRRSMTQNSLAKTVSIVRPDLDEVPTAEWTRQMKTVMGVKVTVSLGAGAHAADELVLDNDEWVVDKETGVIRDFAGGFVIGKLEPAFAVSRPPPPPPVPQEEATPVNASLHPGGSFVRQPSSGFALAGRPTSRETTKSHSQSFQQEDDLPAPKSPSDSHEHEEFVDKSPEKPPPPPPPPTTQTLTITIPHNTPLQLTLETLNKKVLRHVAFVRPAEVSVTEPVTGTIDVTVYTLQAREVIGLGSDLTQDVDAATYKPIDGQKSTATEQSVLDGDTPQAHGYAVNECHFTAQFSVGERAPVVKMPEELKFTTMHEGTKELPVFPPAGGHGVVLDLPPGTQLGDCTVWLDMGPTVHEWDHLWLASASAGAFLIQGNTLMVEGVVIGTFASRGAFIPDVPEDARRGAPSKTVIKLAKECTAAHLQTLLASVVFQNDSRNPSDTPRYVRFGISIPGHRLLSAVIVGIRFETVDDPTVVDFGAAGVHVTFHTDVNVPPALKDHVKPDLFYFASFCDVYDVDTTDFTGGSLSLRITDPEPNDKLDLVFGNPLVQGEYSLTHDGLVVFDDKPQARIVTRDDTHIEMEFLDTSIDAVAGIIRSFTFHTMVNQSLFSSGTALYRHVESRLIVEESAPVVSHCLIKITQPLLIVPASYAMVKYQENGGAVRLCPIDASLDDEGWDGGWIAVRFLSGGTPDDRISLREDDELKLSDPTAPQYALPLRNATASKIPTGLRKKIREILMKRRREMLARRTEMRNKFDALIRARENMNDATVKVVYVRGARLGVAFMKDDGMIIMLDEKVNLDAQTRYDSCSIHRSAVAALLKRITFENISDDPQELHKIVTITANDGLPHATTAAVQVTVEPQDDVTEIVRPNGAARDFRSQSDADKSGYCLFDDCEVQDPDTFVFNGSVLSVDLVGGGDPKGDQLGFLSAAEQRRRQPDVEPLWIEDKGTITCNGVIIGRIEIDLPNPEGSSNVRVTFAPLPEHINLKPIDPLGPPLPEGTITITSHDQAAATPNIVTIDLVQRVLRTITYTNTASKVKTGMRYYQARIGWAGVEGKLKLPLNVAAQLLWNPDFGAEVTYRENAPPVPMLPKVVVNLPEKDIIKTGSCLIRVSPFDECDALGVDLKKVDGLSLSKEKDKIVVGVREHGCRVSYPEKNCVQFNFDYSSKISVKQFNAVLRACTFVVNSDSPNEEPRTVSVEMRNDAGVPLGDLKAKIVVQGEDDPTEITIPVTQLSVARLCPPTLVCQGALVTDPDTSEFDEKTNLMIEIRGGTTTDHVSLLSRGGSIDSEIRVAYLDPNLNPVTPPRSAPGGNKPSSRKPSSAVAVEPDLNDIKVDLEASPLLATVKRLSTCKLVIHVVKCTLFQMQHIIRSIALRFDANAKDRAGKKALYLELTVDKTVSKAGVAVDVLPPLLEAPSQPRPPYAIYGGQAVEILGYHAVPSCHFNEGGTMEFSLTEKAPGCQLGILGKYGVTTKLTGTAADVQVDGKKIGTVVENGSKSTITITLAKGAAAFANKVAKSVGIVALETVAKTGRTALNVRIHASDAQTGFTYTEVVAVNMGDAAGAPAAAVAAPPKSDKPPAPKPAAKRK